MHYKVVSRVLFFFRVVAEISPVCLAYERCKLTSRASAVQFSLPQVMDLRLRKHIHIDRVKHLSSSSRQAPNSSSRQTLGQLAPRPLRLGVLHLPWYELNAKS
jgi:hypothetical protein